MASDKSLKNLFPAMRPKLLALPGGPKVYAPSDMLGERHFYISVGVAVFVHIVIAIYWYFQPKPPVIDVPVSTITIKLGDGKALTVDALDDVVPDGSNTSDVEATLAHLVRDESRDRARVDSVTGLMEKAMGDLSKAAEEEAMQRHIARGDDAERQFVRAPTVQANDGASSEKAKTIVARYEKIVALWVQKFKFYPAEARNAGLSGKTTVRITTDRRGNVRNYVLEGSTGSPVLDRAAIDMVRRANPVPAVPNDYPVGEQFDFLVPVEFTAQ